MPDRTLRPQFLRPAALVVLEALLMGLPVKMDGEQFMLQDGIYGVKRIRRTIGRPELDEEVLLAVEYTLVGFIKQADRLSAQELLNLSADIGMNRHKHAQSKLRKS